MRFKFKDKGESSEIIRNARLEGVKAAIKLIPIGQSIAVLALLINLITSRHMPNFRIIRISFIGVVITAIVWTSVSIIDYRNVDLKGRYVYMRHIILSGISSIFISSVMIFSYLEAENVQRIFLSGIALGTITAGTFILGTFAYAQLTWIIPLGSITILGCISGNSSFPIFKVFLLLVYFIMILNNTNHFSNIFKNSFILQAQAESQTEVISLLLKDFEKQSKDWLWETDSNLLLTHVGEKFKNVTGKKSDELYGKNFINILSNYLPVDGSDGENYIQQLNTILKNNEPFSDIVIEANIGKQKYWWLMSAKPIYTKNGKFNGWRGVGRNITEKRIYEEKLTWQAEHDLLTGIKNKYFFKNALKYLLDKAEDTKNMGLFLIKVTNCHVFKTLRGQDISDIIIKEIARRLLSFSGNKTFTARFDGGEFAIIIPIHNNDSISLGNNLMEFLCKPFCIDDEKIELEFNIGVSLYPKDAKNAETLIECADLALSNAKETGINSVKAYDSIMAEDFFNKLMIINNINQGIEKDEFYLLYQPQVSSETGEIIGAEALIRWKHSKMGIIPPDQFIPLSEKSGKALAIGRWVLERACFDAVKWKLPWTVSINVSGEQFRNNDFVKEVQTVLKKSGLPVERLILEITESAFIERKENIKIMLDELRGQGITIALDDFGTGYSSLNYLHSFPLDEIKIDQSFIRTIGTKNEATPIIDAIIYLSGKLGCKIVAEGVETIEQVEFLKEHGCHIYQGYLYGKPIKQEEIIKKQEEIICGLL